MYAIIETGGKQYKVQEGDIIDVELLDETENIEFKNILLLNNGESNTVGTPFVANAAVVGEAVATVQGPKVIAYKYKKRQNYRRKVGHRQQYTRVKITAIKSA